MHKFRGYCLIKLLHGKGNVGDILNMGENPKVLIIYIKETQMERKEI